MLLGWPKEGGEQGQESQPQSRGTVWFQSELALPLSPFFLHPGTSSWPKKPQPWATFQPPLPSIATMGLRVNILMHTSYRDLPCSETFSGSPLLWDKIQMPFTIRPCLLSGLLSFHSPHTLAHKSPEPGSITRFPLALPSPELHLCWFPQKIQLLTCSFSLQLYLVYLLTPLITILFYFNTYFSLVRSKILKLGLLNISLFFFNKVLFLS